MKNFWRVVGVLLLCWAAFDLYTGSTFLYDVVSKDQQPTLYWVTISAWIVLGISCFFTEDY